MRFVELEKLGEKRKELAILLGRDKGRGSEIFDWIKVFTFQVFFNCPKLVLKIL